jgi:hypothetical protein
LISDAGKSGLTQQGAKMARLLVCDSSGRITADIETTGPVLGDALDHEQAECVVRCAMLMALSALAEGGGWPTAVLENMAAFMASMRSEVRAEQFM